MTGKEAYDRILSVIEANSDKYYITIGKSSSLGIEEFPDIWREIKGPISDCFYLEYKIRKKLGMVSKWNVIYGEYYSSEIVGITYRKGRKTIDLHCISKYVDTTPREYWDYTTTSSPSTHSFHTYHTIKVKDLLEDSEKRAEDLLKQITDKRIDSLDNRIEKCMERLGKLLEEKQKIEEGD